MIKANVNQRKAGALLSYISMFAGYVISLIYTPLMLRLLGQSEYGLYNLVASIVAYLGVLNFGFGSTYLRYYIRYKVQNDQENVSRLNGMFIIIFSCIGLIAVIVGTAAAFNAEAIFGSKLTVDELAKAKVLMQILTLNMAFTFPSSVFTSHITANERFIFQRIVQLVKLVSNPFLVIPALLLGYGSIGMALVMTFLNLGVEIASMVYCLKKLRMHFLFRKFDRKLMKQISVFSSYIFINMLIDQINWNVDKFILGRFHGTVSVAIYGLASQLNTYYISISTAITNVYVPYVHQVIASNNDSHDLINLFTRIGRLQFIILSLLASSVVFFGRAFFYLWAGPDYAGSFAIALLLILPVTIPLIQNIGIEIQRAKNMHQFRSRVYLLIALLNIVLTLWLAKPYGGAGAALGTAVSLIIGNGFAMNWYYHKKVGLDITYFWKQIAFLMPALLLPAAVGIAMNRFADLFHWRSLALFGAIYVIVFCLSMWFFGLNQYEKELVKKPIQKIINRLSQ